MSERTQFIIGVVGLALLFGAYFGALALAGWYDKKEREKRGEPPLFDERQRLARLRAGNHALYTLVVFLFVWVVLDGIGRFAWTGEILDMVLSALLAAWGVWALECIWNDGFISWKHKGISNTYALTVLTIMLNFTNTFRSSGIIKSVLPFIVCLVDMLVLIVVIVYKWWKEKQMRGEEDAL